MGGRSGPIDRGRDRGREIAWMVRREFKAARLDRGLSQVDVGRPAGMSQSEVSRFERGVIAIDLERAVLLFSLVGLDLSVKPYPAGPPLRDRAHIELLERLHARCHRRLRWDTEVPLPAPGDPRAWDAVVWSTVPADRWALPIEAETRPTDRQALERRLNLKIRDAKVPAAILLIPDSRHGRAFVRTLDGGMQARFPVPGRAALEALTLGRHPGGSSIVLL
jgi:transcriptional regulator with XRE-family HTH domain